MILYIRTWLYIRRNRLRRAMPHAVVWWSLVHDAWSVCVWLITAAVAGMLLAWCLR